MLHQTAAACVHVLTWNGGGQRLSVGVRVALSLRAVERVDEIDCLVRRRHALLTRRVVVVALATAAAAAAAAH